MSSKLLINEHPLMLLPSLATAIGLNEAIILQQIHYWIDPRINKNYHQNKYWVYNSYQQWLLQFPFLSKRTLRRAINELEKRELLICAVFNKTPFDKTKWYTIDYDMLNKLTLSKGSGQKGLFDGAKMATSVRPSWPIDEAKMDGSLYTKTTTEIKPEHSHILFESENIIKEAIEMWNTNIPEQNIIITDSRKKRLSQVFWSCFEGDLKLWKQFLNIIVKSDFLMGRITKFRVNFDWAIKEDNLHRIKEGAYSSKETVHQEEVSAKVEIYLSSIKDAIWKEICFRVRDKYGHGALYSWFRTASMERLEENVFLIKTSTHLQRDWFDTYYSKIIQDTICDLAHIEHPKIKIICMKDQ